MYFTGFADEASAALDDQIKVTKELGWTNIEARNVAVGGFPAGIIHDIPDAAFDLLVEKLNQAGVKINCFGSTIANWGKKIDEPMDSSLTEVRRSIPRMQRLGAKLVRIMSFAVRDGEDQMEQERFRRVKIIHRMFADAGITAVHENCMNYGGMGWQFTMKLLENVPGLKLVLDTGNPVATDDRSKPKPYPKQSSWEFYSHVKEHIVYVHIKDDYWDLKNNKAVYTYPGEGSGDVRQIVKDLLRWGYDGGISIEPHLGAIFHDNSAGHSLDAAKLYIEYGRRMMGMVESIRAELHQKSNQGE